MFICCRCCRRDSSDSDDNGYGYGSLRNVSSEEVPESELSYPGGPRRDRNVSSEEVPKSELSYPGCPRRGRHRLGDADDNGYRYGTLRNVSSEEVPESELSYPGGPRRDRRTLGDADDNGYRYGTLRNVSSEEVPESELSYPGGPRRDRRRLGDADDNGYRYGTLRNVSSEEVPESELSYPGGPRRDRRRLGDADDNGYRYGTLRNVSSEEVPESELSYPGGPRRGRRTLGDADDNGYRYGTLRHSPTSTRGEYDRFPNRSNYLLVAAIDFGTTYSGWAFSFKHEYLSDPIKVSTHVWSTGQLASRKCPTCLLIKPDGKTLHSFGYEAENKYAELAEDGEHTQWYFFKRFKMKLFGEIGVKKDILLEDATGKKLPAKTVFVLSIRYLKYNMLKTSDNRISDDSIKINDIRWVLTVPAIWNDAAKQFMREAAVEAGILDNKLTIALEPEAASLYCRHLPTNKSESHTTSLGKFPVGTKYMVLDAGGGTVDITVHEVMSKGYLKELHKASGGAWGGTKVDDAYKRFLTDLVGKTAMKKFEEEKMEDYLEIIRNFEIKKRELMPEKSGKITFRVPVSLSDTYTEVTGQNLKDAILKTQYVHQVVVTGDKCRVDASIVKGFFRESVKSITDHVSSLLQESKVRGCKTIVMVGGFSEAHMLQEAFRERFSPNINLIIPEEAGLAVLKGAVIFGHEPTTIASRICKYTYGISASHFTGSMCNHPPTERYIDEDGKLMCREIFNIHVKVGQSVKIGEEQKEHIYAAVDDNRAITYFTIYASSSQHPFLVTENGCRKIGYYVVPIPRDGGKNRKIGVSMMFGGTEIRVKFVNKITGEVSMTHVDFLG